METIIGEAILIVIGNPDFLRVCVVFTLAVSILFAVVYMWKHIEEWREQ